MSRINNQWLKNYKLENHSMKYYNNYMEGLIWCISDYNNGKCNNFQYMFKYINSPHPLGLYYYLLLDDKEIEYPKSDSVILNNKIYGLLALPKKLYNKLDDTIIERYKKEDKNGQIKFLYEEEECVECKNHHEKLHKFHMTLSCLNEHCDESEEDLNKIELVKKQISLETSAMMTHKKVTHKKITLDQINLIFDLLK